MNSATKDEKSDTVSLDQPATRTNTNWTSRTLVHLTTPVRTPSSPRSNVTPNALRRHHTSPACPTAQRKTPGSASRMKEIQRALTMPPENTTPTKIKKREIVIVSSDDDTDVDSNDHLAIQSASRIRSSESSSDARLSPVSTASSSESLEFSLAQLQMKDYSRVSRPLPRVDPNVFNSGPSTVTLTGDSSKNSASPTVLQFARSSFGTDLNVTIISHCDEAQKLLDRHEIAWGVQYEMARGVCSGHWTWEMVQNQVLKLTGRNAEVAYQVEPLLKGRNGAKPSDMHIWRQLDLEQDAILENTGRGLGLMGDFQGVRDWYGGRIQQIGRLTKEGGTYRIKLDKMESKRSHRFARYYGSRRFLQIRVPKDYLHDDKKRGNRKTERESVLEFFRQKFILCGRVYVAFHAKEKNVYLVETNEDYQRDSQTWCGDMVRFSLNQFINWHNPLEVGKNTQQVITKFTARFALGLSNSKPALEFKENNIFFIDDITAEDWPVGEKGAPADKLMTDGCGLINHAALQSMMTTIGYTFIPAGIQGRIGGSKGFFILHPDDYSREPRIWIRQSQNKIKYESLDRAHRILDLLCSSQLSQTATLSRQSIINLYANGVNQELLVKLMEQGLEEEVAPLLEWDKPHAALHLYEAIFRCGGVSGYRNQRVAYSLNRVLGFTGRDWQDGDGLADEDAEDDEEAHREVFTGRNEYSGAPQSLHEVAIELLQSGFLPRDNVILRTKIKYILKTIIRTSVEKHRIPVPDSAMSFIVPDPLGILKEGEIFYRFSTPRTDSKTGHLRDCIEGDVLVGRYPIRLPSDIQRVKAVYKRELDRWPDVLVVSVKGKRSLASLLADGDMDGDEAVIIYDEDIVSQFKNRDFTQPPPNLISFISSNFDQNVESVEQFCERVSGYSARKAHEEFQDVLVSNLCQSVVGLYSTMHERGCLQHGYDDIQTIRLAYIFATLLDSSKNGCRLKKGLLEQDSKKYGWSKSVNHGVSDILAILKRAGEEKGNELKNRFSDLGNIERESDAVLLAPAEAGLRTAQKYPDYAVEFKKIEAHIGVVHEEYKKAMRRYHLNKASSNGLKSRNEDIMVECAKKFAEVIPDISLIHNVEEVKASCAYSQGHEMGFAVAFGRLCQIKAQSKGLAPSVRIFDEAKKISQSYLRAVEWADEDH